MSNEKIQLPDFLIAELYKGSLVEITADAAKNIPVWHPQEPKGEKAVSAQKIDYLGENKTNTTIIVNQPEAVYLNENDLVFLTSILKACQLDVADIAIVNNAKQEVDFTTVKEQLHAQNILLFAIVPSAIQLPFMIPDFQIQKYSDCSIMIAPALSFINQPTQEGKLLKTKLWVSLKQVFGIK